MDVPERRSRGDSPANAATALADPRSPSRFVQTLQRHLQKPRGVENAIWRKTLSRLSAIHCRGRCIERARAGRGWVRPNSPLSLQSLANPVANRAELRRCEASKPLSGDAG